MGFESIGITKYKEENSIIYYFVSTRRNGFFEFFIGIDKKNNIVIFFQDKNLKKILGVVDFAITERPQLIDHIDLAVSNRVALQVYRAICDNKFPDVLTVNN